MKRAKKTGLPFFNKEKKYEDISSEIQRKTNTPDIKLNEDDNKNFQMKYFGKLDDEVQNEDVLINKDVQPEELTEEGVSEISFVTDEKETSDSPAEMDAQTKRIDTVKGKKSKPKGIKRFLPVFLVSLFVIVIASVGIMGIGGLFQSPIEEELAPVNDVSGKVNVMLLGVDKEGLRTDTIVVLSIDTDDKTVNMLSIPRDTRMYVGSRYQKINSAHALSGKNGKIKGPAATIEAVTRLTGIPINYYAEFSFSAFRDTIDTLGGINFNVPQRMKYSDPTQGLKIDLYPGEQLLDGDEAEQLVRFRQYPQGDIKRVEVQQQFIKAVIEQKLNVQIVGKISELYKTLTKNVKTNMKLTDVLKYAQVAMELDFANMQVYELPGEYSGEEYVSSYWIPDMKQIKLLVQNTFGYDTKDITSGKAKENAVYGELATEKLNPEDVVDETQPEPAKKAVKEEETKEETQDKEKKDKQKDKINQEEETEKEEISTIPTDSKTQIKEDTEDVIINNETSGEQTTKEEPKADNESIAPIIRPDEKEDFVRPGAN